MSKLVKLTRESFIERASHIHNNVYDYKYVYIDNGNRSKVLIICNLHGEFTQVAGSHLRGQSCKKCFSKKESLELSSFIDRAKNIHNDRYDYSLVNYSNNKKKVDIICNLHGCFKQTPNSHLNGNGCRKCSIVKKSIYFRNDFDIIKNMLLQIHDKKYDYSLVKYINSKDKVDIICPKHGIFKQSIYTHKKGHGCPSCKESNGEKAISTFLNEIKVSFLREHSFSDCRNRLPLEFDFYLPTYNLCIEYDGKQHFESNDFFGGEEAFTQLVKNDNIKNQYCHINNIKLIRIDYNNQNNIKNILEKCLN